MAAPQDAVIRGDISLNMPRQQVDYCKRLALGGGAVLALNASCRLEGAPAGQGGGCGGHSKGRPGQ